MSNGIFTNKEIQQKAYIVLGLAGLLVVLQVINALTGNALDMFALIPREFYGASGILFSPFIHGSFVHLWSNLFGFIVLSGLIIWQGIGHYCKITLFIMISTGTLVWLLGPTHTIIVGASGVIFGYLGYLLSQAFISADKTSILIALAVGFFYGGALFGIFPGTPGVSWESHLAGLVCGIFAAYFWKENKKIK